VNTPRLPNARPGTAPFLGQSRNTDTPAAPASSFVASFVPVRSTEAAETTGNVTGDRSVDNLVTRASLNESLAVASEATMFNQRRSRERG
jgi:hypothetical protein